MVSPARTISPERPRTWTVRTRGTPRDSTRALTHRLGAEGLDSGVGGRRPSRPRRRICQPRGCCERRSGGDRPAAGRSGDRGRPDRADLADHLAVVACGARPLARALIKCPALNPRPAPDARTVCGTGPFALRPRLRSRASRPSDTRFGGRRDRPGGRLTQATRTEAARRAAERR